MSTKKSKKITKKKAVKKPAKKAAKKNVAKKKVAKKPAKKAAQKKVAKKAAKKPAKKVAKKISNAADMVMITNVQVLQRPLLAEMMQDSYFPKHLVTECQWLLLKLAAAIEASKPLGVAVYEHTQATTESFNEMIDKFDEAGSDLETAARECIAGDIDFILKAYGYAVDLEEAISNRDW
jgi:hypothetical protein